MWFLAALNRFLLLVIPIYTETSFTERASNPIILEISLLFQFDKVFQGIVEFRSIEKTSTR